VVKNSLWLQSEVGEGGREVVEWSHEKDSQGEVGKRMWKRIDFLVESVSQGEVSEKEGGYRFVG
jgi:hypothetical protein